MELVQQQQKLCIEQQRSWHQRNCVTCEEPGHLLLATTRKKNDTATFPLYSSGVQKSDERNFALLTLKRRPLKNS